MKKVVGLLLIALVASLAVVVVSPAGAKKGHPKGTAAAKRHAVGGVVQSVASDSVTLTRKKGDPVTVQVNGDTKIVVNGKSATLSDVKIGYVALARVPKAGGPAKLLRAHAVPALGTIVAGQVDSVGGNSITLKKKDGSTVTIAVNADTKIFVSGKAATLADVETGYVAYVSRTAADGPAAVIRGVREEGRCAQAARPRRRRFRWLGLDHAQGTGQCHARDPRDRADDHPRWRPGRRSCRTSSPAIAPSSSAQGPTAMHWRSSQSLRRANDSAGTGRLPPHGAISGTGETEGSPRDAS